MDSFAKTVQQNTIVQSALFIVLGMVLLFAPGITLMAIVICIGVVFAISGIIALVSYAKPNSPSYKMSGALTTGIFCIVIALVMFIFPTAIASLLTVALGAILILCGIANTVRSIGLKSYDTNVWITGAVIGVLVAIGGVVIIWNPFETTELFVMVLGVLLIANGVGNLIIELKMRKLLNQGRQQQ